MDLDELLFLQMIAQVTKLLMPKNIGTFLHHAVLDAIISGAEENEKAIMKSLRDLFSENGNDLLFVTKIHGINDFRNLELLQSYELMNGRINMSGITDCYKGLIVTEEMEQKFQKVKSQIPFQSPTPCSNLSSHPNCKDYCNWQERFLIDWTTLQLNHLER